MVKKNRPITAQWVMTSFSVLASVNSISRLPGGYIFKRINQTMTSNTNISGTAPSIQSPKLMESPFSAMKLIAIALGGVPIGVPNPPRLQAKGMDRASPLENRFVSGILLMIGRTMANIMAVVAVLLIHMDRRAETTMIPNRSRAGFVPVFCSNQLAIRLSS